MSRERVVRVVEHNYVDLFDYADGRFRKLGVDTSRRSDVRLAIAEVVTRSYVLGLDNGDQMPNEFMRARGIYEKEGIEALRKAASAEGSLNP